LLRAAGKSSEPIRDGRKMICGGCSLSRYQHYCAVPDRWSVAMTITFVAVASLIIGIVIGAVVAGLVLMERQLRHWVVCIRLLGELHRRLREEATDYMCSLKAEIINRLQASLSQPKVVDAPGL
jgi:hypothetical protein